MAKLVDACWSVEDSVLPQLLLFLRHEIDYCLNGEVRLPEQRTYGYIFSLVDHY